MPRRGCSFVFTLGAPSRLFAHLEPAVPTTPCRVIKHALYLKSAGMDLKEAYIQSVKVFRLARGKEEQEQLNRRRENWQDSRTPASDRFRKLESANLSAASQARWVERCVPFLLAWTLNLTVLLQSVPLVLRDNNSKDNKVVRLASIRITSYCLFLHDTHF